MIWKENKYGEIQNQMKERLNGEKWKKENKKCRKGKIRKKEWKEKKIETEEIKIW